MKESASMGANKTGVQTSPRLTKEMIDHDKTLVYGYSDDKIGKTYHDIRKEYQEESGRTGSIPIPASAKGLAQTGMQKLSGKNPEVLIDKLGERLAFERGGVRLYEALIAKCKNLGHMDAVRQYDFEQILADEQKHIGWLEEIIESLGADPTALTPSANTTTVASQGIFKVVSDPRSTVAASAHAIVAAELIDNDGWELLIKLCKQMGLDQEGERFAVALEEEQDHLERVKSWMEQLITEEAKITLQ